MKPLKAAIWVFLSLPLLAFAQETLSLKDAVQMALERSPTLKAKREAILKAEYAKKEALSRFFPSLQAQYSYSRLDEAQYTLGLRPKEVTLNLPPPIGSLTIPAFEPYKLKVSGRDIWGLDLTLVQPLYTGGALRASYELSKLGLDAARTEEELVRLELVFRVKQAYFQVLQAEKALDVARRALEALKEHHRVAKAFYEQGMIPKNDLLQVEVELSQREQDVLRAQNGLLIARAYLNTLIGKPLEEEVKLSEVLSVEEFEAELGACIEKALQARPELKLSRISVEAKKKEVDIARSGLLPQVSLVFDYKRTGDDPLVDGLPGRPDPDTWTLMAVLKWRLWDWGGTYFALKGKKAEVVKAEYELQDLLDRVRLEVKEAFLALQESKQRIGLSKKVLEQAEENFRMNQERYRLQVARSSDVLDALAMLTRAQNNYWIALADYNIALARLKRAMGEE